MTFFMEMDPPTCTAQMKKISVVRGRPVIYDPLAIREAKQILCTALLRFRPDQPMDGPLELNVQWCFPCGKSHNAGEWRSTRPDTDNLEKLLKDCMTKCGFWHDDAQVVREVCEKKWSDEPCGIKITVSVLTENENVQKP